MLGSKKKWQQQVKVLCSSKVRKSGRRTAAGVARERSSKEMDGRRREVMRRHCGWRWMDGAGDGWRRRAMVEVLVARGREGGGVLKRMVKMDGGWMGCGGAPPRRPGRGDGRWWRRRGKGER